MNECLGLNMTPTIFIMIRLEWVPDTDVNYVKLKEMFPEVDNLKPPMSAYNPHSYWGIDGHAFRRR